MVLRTRWWGGGWWSVHSFLSGLLFNFLGVLTVVQEVVEHVGHFVHTTAAYSLCISAFGGVPRRCAMLIYESMKLVGGRLVESPRIL